MQKNGISWVRIVEFAWFHEPSPGVFEWGWPDKVVDILGNNGQDYR